MVKLPAFSFLESILLDVLLALSTHLIYNRLEVQPVNLLATFFLLEVMPAIATFAISSHLSTLWFSLVVSHLIFYATLVISIVLYRISPFHPLADYPGPFLAKISKFYAIWITMHDKQHLHFKRMHEKYGDYIRVGPNELSFANVDAIDYILGPAGMPKGPLWEGRAGKEAVKSLIALRDTREHARRRKLWNRAFSTTALKNYEPIIRKRALQLVEELERKCAGSETVNLAMWLSFFAFDFMGDMAFGGGFELMSEGDKDGIRTMIESAIDVVALLQQVSWAARLLYLLPAATKNVARYFGFARSLITQRMERGSAQVDLFHYLIDEAGHEKEPPIFEQIFSDAALAIAAGSDTTSTVLSGTFFYLLSHPESFKRLQEELDREGADTLDTNRLAELPYLSAVINETLRLQPAVCTGLQRSPALGSGGHWVGTRFIPEGTGIFVPPYVLHRDPRHFSPRPDEFWPERWLASVPTAPKAHDVSAPSTSPNIDSVTGTDSISVTIDQRAFLPFSVGPANCVGRNLARAEMRVVLALLVRRFEIRFAPGYNPVRWDAELQDLFIMKTGSLPVILKLRN